jgi:hypothetical protein
MVGLAGMLLLVEVARHHRPAEAAFLLAIGALAGLSAAWLLKEFRAHPAGFPEPSSSHGLRMTVTTADERRSPSRWASQRKEGP